ncbi:transposase [Pleurocapsales cyanobacterium LEGE 06147]|nr:transposase [Pleurocapsales cyanobacterium LEGE 06147]
MTRKAKGKGKRTGGTSPGIRFRGRALQKAGLNRSLLDVGISTITSLIKYKLEEAGGIFVDVPLKIAPSQTCPHCGSKRKKDLSERIHTCDCGIAPLDRDVAAAIVMLDYAKGVWNELPNNRGACVPTSKPTNCGGWKQTQEMRRQKLSALRSDSKVAE